MRPSIILYKVLPGDLLYRLEEHSTVTQVPNLRPETVAQHVDALANAEGLLGSSEAVNTALPERMPRLRATSTVSIGCDNSDVNALSVRKVLLMRTPTVLTGTVTDTVTALVLNTARRAVEITERIGVGEWTKDIRLDQFGTDVHHKTLGIVGMDRTGLALAQRAHFGFSMPILYNARRYHHEAEERFNARYCDPDTLLQESDFVCLILSLIDETHHLSSTEQLVKTKSSAIFTNAGCGSVADEKALIVALRKSEIHAAGLDVFEREPSPVDSPLLSLPNVVVVPHIGSATREMRYNMAACAVDNLIDALQGRVGKNCVNLQVAS